MLAKAQVSDDLSFVDADDITYLGDACADAELEDLRSAVSEMLRLLGLEYDPPGPRVLPYAPPPVWLYYRAELAD